MKKDLNLVLLLDFYGAVLKDRQREIMELYYNEDLSLGEIAENTGITRQGVFDALKKSALILTDLDKKLGLAKRFASANENIEKTINELKEILDEKDKEKITYKINKSIEYLSGTEI